MTFWEKMFGGGKQSAGLQTLNLRPATPTEKRSEVRPTSEVKKTTPPPAMRPVPPLASTEAMEEKFVKDIMVAHKLKMFIDTGDQNAYRMSGLDMAYAAAWFRFMMGQLQGWSIRDAVAPGRRLDGTIRTNVELLTQTILRIFDKAGQLGKLKQQQGELNDLALAAANEIYRVDPSEMASIIRAQLRAFTK